MAFRCGHFLGTMDAGDTCASGCVMYCVNRRPTAVVTCFQRVMLLGLLAAFAPSTTPSAEADQRAGERVPPFSARLPLRTGRESRRSGDKRLAGPMAVRIG